MGIVANGADMVNGLDDSNAVPRYFRRVAWASLLWNSLGVVDYVLTSIRNTAYMAHYPAEMGRWLQQMPQAVHGLWALGVWGSLAGSLLMLARSRHAGLAFLLSFVGAAGSYGWQFAQDMPARLDTLGFNIMAGAILAVIFGLWWYSRSMFWYGVLK